MPIQKISGGYRFGEHGKIYRGLGAREKARKQGVAIHISQEKTIQVKSSSRAKGYERRL
jgi:hypothetical protein